MSGKNRKGRAIAIAILGGTAIAMLTVVLFWLMDRYAISG
jgi:hypothetical protein